MIKEDYITFEQAKKLKELGFNVPCYTFYDIVFPKDGEPQFISSPYCHNHNINPEYDGVVSAPTLSLVAKWLEEKNIHIDIYPNSAISFWSFAVYTMDKDWTKQYLYVEKEHDVYYDSKSRALFHGINKALELIK